jgi:hypothetical protein
MDKVSFVIVRADQEGLCGATVNAGMERRLCIREGCAVHKAEDGRAERELSVDHMYLLAPVSNNKLVVIPFPRLDLEGLDEVTKLSLPGRPAVDRANGISIISLLSLECTEGRLWGGRILPGEVVVEVFSRADGRHFNFPGNGFSQDEGDL